MALSLCWKVSLLALLLTGATPEEKLIAGARSCLGDRYDAAYYAGGPPPRGRGACTDVVYYAFKRIGIDLQAEVDRLPDTPDPNIDYRRCPTLIQWFRKNTRKLPNDKDFQPGDVVFWSLTGDGVADHCGIVSHNGYVVHNFPPLCTEEKVLSRWPIVGHFRRKK
jgi:uncharacterized protein